MNRIARVLKLPCLLVVCGVCSLLPFAYAHADETIVTSEVQKDPSPPVFMCVDPDWWPFETIDERGSHVGIAADLVALATSRAKLQVALYPTKTWEESVAASKAGKCQLASFLNQSPERDQWLIFTEPLLVDPNVLIVREDSPPLGDLATLKGRSIALPKESAVYERVRRDFPNLKLIGTDSEYEAFGMVSNRKADMTLRSRIVAGQNIKEKGWFNLKIASEVPGYENVLRMGVLKSLPALRDQLSLRRDQDGYRRADRLHAGDLARRGTGRRDCNEPVVDAAAECAQSAPAAAVRDRRLDWPVQSHRLVGVVASGH